MGQVRFSTVRDLFEAYPLARYDVGNAAPDKLSLDFLQEAADAGNWHQAVSFCAYLLPRRVAVAWGCRSLRQMFDNFDGNEGRSLNFAETWVRQPDEQSRNKALAVGNANDPEQPADLAGAGGGLVWRERRPCGICPGRSQARSDGAGGSRGSFDRALPAYP
ncbi:hypothetical protein ACVWW1_001232 [Bradyrhizobium sp. JR3.5]